MKGTYLFMMSLAAATALVGCSNAPKGQVASFTGEDMDTTVDPSVDFYKYANGGWIKQHPLPDDKSRFGVFDLMAEENRERLKEIINDVAANKGPQGSVSQKIGDFYASGLDMENRNANGYSSLKPYLEKIAGLTDKSQVPALTAELQLSVCNPFFNLFPDADAKNSSMCIATLWQGGLGLPDRDYYFEPDDRSKSVREAYVEYLTTLFTLVGNDSLVAAEKAQKVFDFESRLAEVSSTKLENRVPENIYNKMSVDSLKLISPDFAWNVYFEGMQVTVDEVNVSQPKFFAALSQIIADANIDVLKDYMTINLLADAAPYLSDDFVAANFKYSSTITGVKEMQPLWKRVIGTINGTMGEAVGQLYVEKYFPATAKARMLELVENLRTAFGQRIDNLTWMSDSTKAAAKDKLAAIMVKIGYPDKWKDYSDLQIVEGDYAANLIAASKFLTREQLNKIGKPVDKSEWFMNPQEVNAYYNPSANEIVFPAGILQPPFFYADGDDAVNYGAIGVVIGHEMTHGFDDMGRKYDKDGNMNNWWTPEDSEKFKATTQRLVDFYNEFIVIDTLRANGELTLGENIADNGGLNIAYQAYSNSRSGKPAPEPIDGFTDDQRFLLAYARVWAGNIRDEQIYLQTKTDPHSLGSLRVNGQMPLFDLFYKSFDIKENSPMYLPEDKRIVIW